MKAGRLGWFFKILILTMIFLIGRLVVLQLIDGEYYNEYGLEGVDICFCDSEDAEALSKLLKRATSITF